MKKKTKTKLEIIICIIGLILLLYPSVSNYWNSKYASKVIIEYDNLVEKMVNDEYAQMKEDVIKYNELLASKEKIANLSDEEKNIYNSLLDVDGEGSMGYLEIDVIKVKIPIGHGVSEKVLQDKVGHLEWSSLPMGGENTHVVLSAHTGLNSVRLFTDLSKLKVGDRFVINVLKEKLIYEVDQIKVAKPYELNDLQIIEGEDLVTLTTCTPYGVNTDRLLVRGHRVINDEEFLNVRSNAVLISKYIVALLLCIVPLLIFIIVVILKK